MSPPPSSRGAVGRERSARLLTGPVGPTLVRLALPMVAGLAAIILFTVVDTYFVGKLGAAPLAAMSFCFPVNFVVYSVTMGIGIGTTSVIARAIGEGDRARVRRLTTHALVLALGIVTLIAGLGLATMDPIFTAMGADASILPMIRDYMTPWFMGVGLLVIPMVGNSAIRATGDTVSPSAIMIVAGVVNILLDPILIFGWGPVPALGLSGAAIATVISWSVTFAAASWLLIRRERMIVFERPTPSELWASWRAILHVGLPAAGTNLLVPLSTGILTRFVAGYGTFAVAAFGVGGRMEALAMIGINAMATALTPFVGQNYGAGRCERIRQALGFGSKVALAWGSGAALVLGLLAPAIARIFNDQPDVVAHTVDYMRLIPFSYGLLGIAMLVNTTFVALGKPLQASLVIGVRLFVLAIPLAWLGSTLFDLRGLFAGVAIGNVLACGFAYALVRRHLGKVERQIALSGPSDPTSTVSTGPESLPAPIV